jgi:sugar (pentulose or hexulose) kinase
MLSTGTAWVLYTVLDNPIFDTDEAIIIYCHASPGKWAFMSPLNGGIVLDYFINEFCTRESEEAERSGSSPYDIIFEGSPDPKGLIFIPHLYGSVSPDWQSDAKGAIWGITLNHTRKDVAAAIMESLAFESLRSLQVMWKLGVSPDEVSMLGGAARSATWPQVVADVLGLRIRIPETTEAAALGAAFLAGVGCGMLSYDSLPEARSIGAFEPSTGRHESLMEKFKAYRKAIEFSYSLIDGSEDGQ